MTTRLIRRLKFTETELQIWFTFSEYQHLAERTADKANPKRLEIGSLGLGGEAGEVLDIIKKHVGHGHDLDKEKLKRELGDVLWYVAEIASTCGFNFDEIARINIDKLKARYPNGFSTQASIARVDEQKETNHE